MALNGYRWDNFEAHVYRTDDYGQSWRRIGMDPGSGPAEALPHEPVNVIVEDPDNEDLLYVGTDHGVYVSFDRGQSFMGMAGQLTEDNTLPNAPVHDLKVHPRDAELIVGTHDFSAFAAVGQEKPHYRCNVAVSEWRERPADEGFIFTIEADRFLHRMVRFLVGSMVDIARGRRPLTDMEMLLASTDNRRTSSPAPAQGLHMVGPRYPQPELQQINEFVNRQ